MFALLAFVSLPVGVDRRLAAAALPLLLLVSPFMFALLAFVSFHVALDRRLAAAALLLLKNPGLKNTWNEHKECF